MRYISPGRFILLAASFALAMLAAVPAHAVLIELKNGRFYDGEILEETDDAYIVKLEDRTTRLKKDKVLKIHEPSTSGNLQDASDGEAAEPSGARKALPSSMSSFTRGVLSSRTPVVVFFTARQCGPCQEQEALIRRVGNDYHGKVRVEWVDIEREGTVAAEYGVNSLPRGLVARDGRYVDRWTGRLTEQRVRAMFAALTRPAAPAASPELGPQ